MVDALPELVDIHELLPAYRGLRHRPQQTGMAK